MLAEVLDPGALHTGIVFGRFDKVHEIGDVCVEALLKRRVRDPLFLGEGERRPSFIERGSTVRVRQRALRSPQNGIFVV
jgi:hypothetical protein